MGWYVLQMAWMLGKVVEPRGIGTVSLTRPFTMRALRFMYTVLFVK